MFVHVFIYLLGGRVTSVLAVALPEAISHAFCGFHPIIIPHFLVANGGHHPLTMTVLVSVWVIMQMLATGCVSQDDALQSGDKGTKRRGGKDWA